MTILYILGGLAYIGVALFVMLLVIVDSHQDRIRDYVFVFFFGSIWPIWVIIAMFYVFIRFIRENW